MMIHGGLQAQFTGLPSMKATKNDHDKDGMSGEYREMGSSLKKFLEKYRIGFDEEEQNQMERVIMKINDESMNDRDRDFEHNIVRKDMGEIETTMTDNTKYDASNITEMTNMNAV